MSHLRAPAARADRREGGRHGRPASRTAPALHETHIRPQLLRLAVLPPVAVALSACAAVLFTVRSTGVRPGPVLWSVLGGAVSVALAAVVIAAVAADRAARSVHERVGALRRSTARGEGDLRAVVEALRRGETPPPRKPRGGPPDDADDFELLAADLSRARDGAVTAVVRAAQLSSQAGSEQKLEVFVNLARRLQSLVHREISILDELENEIEDPDLLKGLFHVDHLATRIRRHAENLAVLGGAVSRRQWSNPVDMTEVLRSAIAEVEQYSRVRLVPPIDGTLRGHAVADVIHLLAELVENATLFSAPQTQVLMRANLVTSGLAVEVEDRGLGMPVAEQSRMNALLADPDQVNVARLLADGRIGLYVVSQLAKRHGITVRLQTNIYGGVQAVLVLPQALLGTAPGTLDAGVREQEATGATPSLLPPSQQPRPPATPLPLTSAGPAPGVPASAAPGPGAPVPALQVSGVPAPAAPAPGTPVTPAPGSGVPAQAVPGPGMPVPAQPSPGAPLPAPPVSGAPASALPGTGAPASDAPGSDAPGSDAPVSVASGSAVPAFPAPAPGAPAPWAPVPAGSQGSRAAEGGGPLPLPVRGAREDRANPAAAVPGLRPGDRGALAEHAATPPVPRHSAVRGTMDKPRLPRRRAHEHIAPQLRGGPAPRPDTDPGQLVGHDPGLMAAFQRGVGLAEAQQHLEQAQTEPARTAPPHSESPPTAPVTSDASPRQPARTAYSDAHRLPAPRADRTASHDGSEPAG
ncbi:ATP-binding protein [Streptomyces sp. CL12-4]|uniref:ATP-binding protein n=1 Tax=Streptomyces sp. CL12-4 TaxID=2810306 RepID=UPI001EFAD0B2|nr:ATP-binding protein [Streptomyces sp. CL12-4]MCG8965609.1 ATP-binding protein [Streptomyces sp. CL12-4]